ncbi:MAG: structural protein P5 [Prevotellaceae bacterium]|jgi:hypothetical protein|nr:structural protein P5 [Prevotellaceae bacterium]
MKPRGIRNNNPLNLRHSRDTFKGEKMSTDKDFEQYESIEYGYRAAFVTLHTYLTKYGLNTIEKIITRFAPPNENNTGAYIATVAKYSGVAADEALTATSGDKYILIVSAMSFVENGVNADILQIKAGFNLQTKITMQ